MAFEYAIVLTGSIATGKSTVATCFNMAGFTIVDADEIAHEVLDTQAEKIAEIFGDTLLKKGKVDRKALGCIIFSDQSKRQALEALLHPLIYEEIEYLSKELDNAQKPYIVDIPLFFEGGRYPIENSIVVYAPKELQLKRVIRRDGYNEEDALKRIASQMDIEQKRELATYVIDNSGDREALKRECERVKEKILGDFK
ncbi:Dephospho-CoA kinase [hydrothermal vent metagenome]|uniref:Dephospho-CoA kinase n=1 Tax=hydrothermal vent metagenome TaxID=652676 RepID=A0A1W1B8Y0_9ZZZZ